MNRLLIIFLVLVSINCVGQDSNNSVVINLSKSHNPGVRPEYRLVLDTIEILLDSAQVAQLNLELIRKVKILKGKKAKQFYNSSGVVLIYPKKKYKLELVKEFIE